MYNYNAMLQLFLKTSPFINNVSEPYVHHILIFLCNDLEESDLGPGAECFTNASRHRVDSCTSLSGTLLAGWAVGGSVSKLYNNISMHTCRILFILIMLPFQLVMMTMSLLQLKCITIILMEYKV